MTTILRQSRAIAALTIVGLFAAGCSSTGSQSVAVNTVGQPAQLQPLPNSSVNSSSLPPLQANGQPAPGLSGTPVLGGVPATTTADAAVGTGTTSATTTASIDPALGQPGGTAPQGGARDLSGGLTVEKLTGTWNVASGPAQCRLNLTFTAKTGTSRYRASTPGCTIAGIASVASWTVAGSQVQLFDEGGKMIAALVMSGGRFIGTSAGGAAISMTS